MKYIFEYTSPEQRVTIIAENNDKYLIVEKNIREGNFLVFTDVKPVEIEIEELKQANQLIRAQNNATSERADFIEDVMAEMATQVYQ